MLKKLIESTIARHHHWRRSKIDEVTELYWSQFLRSLSLGLVNIFVPIYLYKLGYPIADIFWFYAWFFALRPFLDLVTSQIIARIGPKHTMVVGTLLQLLHLSLLLSLDPFRWPLWFVAAAGGWAYGLFMQALHVDFSKVKHHKHAGKELGVANIFERSGAVLGPLTGGLVASFFGAQYTLILAILVLIGSLIPIFLSAEPVKTHQILRYDDFEWKKYRRDMVSSGFLTVENMVAIVLWPLFVGIYVFAENTYAYLGVVTALGTVGALATAYYIGKFADRGRGHQMIRLASYGNSIVHLFRPFVSSFGQVIGVNLLSDPLAMGYRIPYTKGFYERAGSLPGKRIVYLGIMSSIASASRFVFWLSLWVLVQFVEPRLVVQLGFVLGAVVALGVTLERFPSLSKDHGRT